MHPTLRKSSSIHTSELCNLQVTVPQKSITKERSLNKSLEYPASVRMTQPPFDRCASVSCPLASNHVQIQAQRAGRIELLGPAALDMTPSEESSAEGPTVR